MTEPVVAPVAGKQTPTTTKPSGKVVEEKFAEIVSEPSSRTLKGKEGILTEEAAPTKKPMVEETRILREEEAAPTHKEGFFEKVKGVLVRTS
jgi:hypothetical protein